MSSQPAFFFLVIFLKLKYDEEEDEACTELPTASIEVQFLEEDPSTSGCQVLEVTSESETLVTSTTVFPVPANDETVLSSCDHESEEIKTTVHVHN